MNKAASLLIINDSNINTGIVHKEHKVINSGLYWHKIFVQNATKYSREFVLRTIMNAVHPLDFIPVSYAIENDYATFMLKNCGPSITKMCLLNLTIPHPDEQKKLPPFKLTIKLNHAEASEFKVEIQNNIMSVLQRRYNTQSKVLNLEYFIKDPELQEFCPLSQPKLLYFVLYLSKDFPFQQLKLNGNELETLTSIQALHNSPAGKALSVLDLRRNNISKGDELESVKGFNITEIHLSSNPLTQNLSECDYVKLIKSYWPQIKKIDNRDVPEIGVLAIKRNYVCDPLGVNFVDHFLEHYFTLYDSQNRELLKNMYHKHSLFSITSNYLTGGGDVSSSSRLFVYKQFSHNLKTLSDLSKGHEFIFYGPTNIGNLLKMLPETEHDPCSFTVDLLQLSEKSATIVITGVFKEPGQSLLETEYFYNFTRTFILVSSNNLEFTIANEMLHVTNATVNQQAAAFKVVKIARSASTIPQAKTQSEKAEMVAAFVALTNLVPKWALKCLKEAEFNLQTALLLFKDLFKADKLPAIAFDFSNLEQDMPTPVAPPVLQQQRIEEIKPMLQPVQKVIQINPVPCPVPHQQEQIITPIVSKQTQKKQKTLGKTLTSVQILKETTIPKQQKASNKPKANTKPLNTQVQESTDKAFELTGSTFVANKPSQLKGITINLQKNKQIMSSTQATENKESIDTNIGDLRMYVKDEIILKVLDMKPETPLDVVKKNLDEACQQVLKQYTLALKYYKAIGREFYRFQLYSDGRTFLTNAMATVPKKMGEQLYCVFTLFEIQYGEQNVAENMILIIAESFEINNAAIFLSKDLPRTNVGFARKVFGMIAASDLEKDKKDVLLKAHIEFEKVFGNVETLKHAQNVYQDCCVAEKPVAKLPQPEKAPEITEIIKTPTPVEPEVIVLEDVKEVPVTTTSKPMSTSSQNDNVIHIIDDSETEITFDEFRTRLLMIADIMPPKVIDSEIDQFLKLTDTQEIETMGHNLLRKYSTDVYVVRLVCKHWADCGMLTKVIQILHNIKLCFDRENDNNAINALICYMKVRECIESKRFVEAKSQLVQKLMFSSHVNMIQIIEDLIQDACSKPDIVEFLQSMFIHVLGPKKTNIKRNKIKLFALLYVGFCKRFNLPDGDVEYQKYFSQLNHFHPEDIAELDEIKERRSKYETTKRLPNELVRPTSAHKTDTLVNRMEEMRMYYYLGNLSMAHKIRNIAIHLDYSALEKNRMHLAGAYYEALYGSPSIAITQMKKCADDSINAHCIWLVCLHKCKMDELVKKETNKLFGHLFMMINPYSQELIFRYYKELIKMELDIFHPRFQIKLNN